MYTARSLALVALTSLPALGAPVSVSISLGSVAGAGFPEPLVQQTPVSTTSRRSGGGSTGGGFAGTASADLRVTSDTLTTTLSISGGATHLSEFGYTAASTAQEVVFSLASAAVYTLANQSRTVVNAATVPLLPITFQGVSGTITPTSATTGRLSAGTYRLRFGAAAGRPNTFSFSVVSAWYAALDSTGCNSTVLDWKLTLRTPCPGDLNGDDVVDFLDFDRFVAAYLLLLCTDPTMPAGCPANLNADAVVDNADFLLFVQAYNNFLCP